MIFQQLVNYRIVTGSIETNEFNTMTKDENKKLSKFLSYVLRHNPSAIQIVPDENGWVNVNELITKLNDQNMKVDLSMLTEVVKTNDKKRFSFNEDQTRMRASQGHSIKIDLDYLPQEPPEILYHGTAEKNLVSIMSTGLLKMERHHVHLSENKSTALAVGERYGKPVLIEIASGEMYKQGFVFYLSENKVWLTEEVPVRFLKPLN